MTRILTTFAAATAVVIGTIAPVSAASASAASVAGTSAHTQVADPTSSIVKTSLSGFTPGNIISDAVFTDENTMTEAQIQSFFESKVSRCQVGKDENGKPFVCLKDFHITSVTRPADAYCSGYTGQANESAARIIHRVARACHINPQVLIVMLQKEQGLVTHTWPSAWRYNIALGQGCPDTAPCDPGYIGFFHQIYGAARQMQMYMEGRYFTWYAPGKTWNILYHPNKGCGTSPVRVANKATSALYYYTPYQPNAAALRAGYGTGDGCSSYGNRNFYNYFTDWFGSTQQTTQCAPPNGGTRAAKLAYVVTTQTTPARIAPRSACDDDAGELREGDIVQATTISGSSQWLKVYTEEGSRWIRRDDVRKSTTAEAKCTIPSGVKPAKLSYTVVGETPARVSPRTGCALDQRELTAGAVVTATNVSGSGLWLKVMTTHGVRWILREDMRKASSAEEVCAYPMDAKAARYGYVVTAKTALRDRPDSSCGASKGTLTSGTAVRAVEAVDGWLKVIVDDAEYWIDRDATRRASTAEALCIAPAGTGPAKLQYVSTAKLTARAAPNDGCGSGASSVAQGALLQAVGVTADGEWLQVEVGSSEKWILRSGVRKATTADLECAQPAATKPAKLTYVVTDGTTARTAPRSGCVDGSAAIAAGTVFTADAVTTEGDWLQTSLAGRDLWVLRADVRKASSSDIACAAPQESRSAFKTYVVLDGGAAARVNPVAECDSGTVEVPAGTVVTASAATLDGTWIKVGLDDGTERWIPRGSVRYATTADLACTSPSGATSAKLWYAANTDTTARAVPDAKCTSGSSSLRNGTIVEAVQLSADGLWLQVRADDELRWVLRSDLRKVPVVTTTTAVYLRSSASTSAPSNGLLAAGTIVAKIGTSTGWVKVQTRSGVGWVSADYVR